MDYRIDLFDAWDRHTASFNKTPLLEVTQHLPGADCTIEGLLPGDVNEIGPGCRLRVSIGGRVLCEAPVTFAAPHWGDARKLILDRYWFTHKLLEVRAETVADQYNTAVARAFTHREISEIVRGLVNAAPGPVYYEVNHTAYPDGAQREYVKFSLRKTAANELETGGIGEGQWVGADRIDATSAYAKDGDTIAGLVVDGAAWPDLRLMLIDCEETALNSHAVKCHPETAFWTSTEYDRSGYKQRADAATQALQNLIDTRGIDYIELNPHRDWAGVFDDRVDVYGRYLGLVFGGGECFNAAMVELELADVYLYEDGRYLVPELALKEFFSYTGAHRDSVENTLARLERFDFDGGLLEAITALAYAVGGVWSINHAGAVSFRVPERPDHVLFADPLVFSLEYGTADSDIVNTVGFKGNPLENGVEKTFVRSPSIAEYGPRLRGLPYYSLATSNDAERFVEGLLDDLAYPERVGEAVFPDGCADLHVGDMLEFRGAPFRRIARSVDGEWGGRFAGTLVARVAEVRHRLSGRLVQTTLSLTSPLRSVTHPLAYMTRSQAAESSLYEFRLDADAVGLDMGFHLT